MVGGDMFSGLATLLGILFLAALLGFIYFIYSFFFVNNKKIKTQIHPTITWELKAKGQKVDTVWIYNFK